MRVIALAAGYHLTRIRAGQEFEYDLEKYGRLDADGLPVLPAWVIPAGEDGRAKFDAHQKSYADKMVAGAIAASGDGASKGAASGKATSFVEATNRTHIGKPVKMTGGGYGAKAPASKTPAGKPAAAKGVDE